MRLRTVPAVCLAVVLLGLSWMIYKIHFLPGPVADEAAYVMMTVGRIGWDEMIGRLVGG